MNRSEPPATDPVDLRIEDVLRYAIAIGATLLLLLPDARGHSELLGWLPMWLLAMPLSAWWALHRFRLPAATSGRRRHVGFRRRTGPQARRRARPAPALRIPGDFGHASRSPAPC